MLSESILGASPFLLLEWWKPIKGWEGRYEISNTGRVWSSRTNKERKASPNKKGYLMVQLRHNERISTYVVHGLVATHFVGDRPEGLLVNHKNGWKRKNWASNFDYMTSLENTRHAIEIGVYKPGTYNRKLSDADVLEIRRLLATGMYTTEIARRFGIDNSAISRIQNGKLFAKVGQVAKVIPNRGERHRMAVLGEQDVKAILALKGKLKQREIAAIYKISTTNVSDIHLRKIWKHVV